jgi:hypothetical protein
MAEMALVFGIKNPYDPRLRRRAEVAPFRSGVGEMSDAVPIAQSGLLPGEEALSPTVQRILAHLCGGSDRCRSFGFVLEWCETRGDCCYAVVCPGCSNQFVVDEDELAELRRWTDEEGNALVCGVQWE